MAASSKAWDRAVASGHIRYFYKFTFLGRTITSIVPYCTGREEMPEDGVIFKPYPCAHEEIKSDEVDSETKVRLPASRLWIEMVIKNSPRLKLEIFRWREELSASTSIFYGNMLSAALAENVISVSFGSPIGASNTELITYYTQRYCNHDLYGRYCGLDFDALKQVIPAGSWTQVGPRSIDIGAPLDFNYWTNGLLMTTIKIDDGTYSFDLEQGNTFKSVQGSVITTKYPLSTFLDTTAPITIAPNCLLDLSRCKAMMGNLSRACAWPDMPRSNYTAMDVTAIGKGNSGNIGRPR